MRGRRDESQRIAPRALGIAARRSRGAGCSRARGRGPPWRRARSRARTCRTASGTRPPRRARRDRGTLQAHRPFPLQVLEGRAGQVRMVPAQGLPRHLLVATRAGRDGRGPGARPAAGRPPCWPSHSPSGSMAGRLRLRYRWPYDLWMSYCSSVVGGGQDDVGVVHGVGLEEVVDDREEVLARETLADASPLRRHRQRVRVVDEDRLHRRRQRPSRRMRPIWLMLRRRVPAGARSGRSRAGRSSGRCPSRRAGCRRPDGARSPSPRAGRRWCARPCPPPRDG